MHLKYIASEVRVIVNNYKSFEVQPLTGSIDQHKLTVVLMPYTSTNAQLLKTVKDLLLLIDEYEYQLYQATQRVIPNS